MGFYQDQNRENYAQFVQNPVKLSQSEPVSTFSIDVDTGKYLNVSRMITQGDSGVKALIIRGSIYRCSPPEAIPLDSWELTVKIQKRYLF